MRFDWLNRTFDNDRDGISTYGARPRPADWTTVSARSRIEPRVFLSFAERFGLSEVDFVFLAIVLRSWVRGCRFVGSFFRADDQHILAKLLGSTFTLFPFVVQLRICNGRLTFRDINQPAIQILSRAIAIILDCGDGMRHLTKIAQENLTTFTFLTYAFTPIEVNRQFSSHGLKAEPQLLHDFGIRRDGFFRFTGKRHPYAGNVHHNGDRTDRQLTAGLSQTVSPPVGPDDRLRDGTSRRLKLKWNTVRVAQHLHRLVFAQVNISHCGEKLIDFLLLELRGRLTSSQSRLRQDLVGAGHAHSIECRQQELLQRPGITLSEQVGQSVQRDLLG